MSQETEGWDLKLGDIFSFDGDDRVMTVTEIADYGIELRFRYLDTEMPGYTILPQN